ncbi:MAG TPA: hypothetical protein VNF71_13180 [Acidimicrobiales bacterium]|nr:hypothetical protein [Acidimicrobiales bacterium]
MQTRAKLLGAATIGAALVLTVPMAAQASTSPLPTPALSTSALPTSTLSSSVSTATASVSQALSPTNSDTGTATVTTPAPAGTAEAYAANVAGAVVISHTKTSASGSGTSSTADPLELGGNPPAGQFGGSQNGAGTTSSALVDTGPSSQFRLQLTPWTASNTNSTASAIADVLTLALGDQTTQESAYVALLQSTSNSSWNSSQSSGNASSDGAIVKAGGPSGLFLDVLHSDTNSNGTGSSYLLNVNGNEIGSNSQVNGQCTLTIPGLLTLNCLTASGGSGLTSTAADVAQVLLGTGGTGAAIGLFHSQTTSGSAPSVSGGSSVEGGNGGGSGSGNGASTSPAASSAAAASGSGSLAFTGSDVLATIVAGLLLGFAGAALVLVSRRRRSAAEIG